MIKLLVGQGVAEQLEPVLLRFCLWGEARGESPIGILAIAWVIKNRAIRSGSNLKHEILRTSQFSCFNPGDPNRLIFENLCEIGLVPNLPSWDKIDAIATIFENSLTIDPTNQALNYYNPEVAKPYWGRGHPQWVETIVIGHHVFGRAG